MIFFLIFFFFFPNLFFSLAIVLIEYRYHSVSISDRFRIYIYACMYRQSRFFGFFFFRCGSEIGSRDFSNKVLVFFIYIRQLYIFQYLNIFIEW